MISLAQMIYKSRTHQTTVTQRYLHPVHSLTKLFELMRRGQSFQLNVCQSQILLMQLLLQLINYSLVLILWLWHPMHSHILHSHMQLKLSQGWSCPAGDVTLHCNSLSASQLCSNSSFWLLTRAHVCVCEQLAHGCHATVQQPEPEPVTTWSQVQHISLLHHKAKLFCYLHYIQYIWTTTLWYDINTTLWW